MIIKAGGSRSVKMAMVRRVMGPARHRDCDFTHAVMVRAAAKHGCRREPLQG